MRVSDLRPFIYNPTDALVEKFELRMSSYPPAYSAGVAALTVLAAEFCTATGFLIDPIPRRGRSGMIDLVLPSGIEAGHLSIQLDGGDMIYGYTHHIVSKTRGDKYSSDKSTRSSKKIHSLLAALRKCNEIYSQAEAERHFFQDFQTSYKYAIPDTREITFRVPPQAALAAAQFALKRTDYIPHEVMITLDAAMSDYDAQVAQDKDKNAVKARFDAGVYVLAVSPLSTIENPVYYFWETEKDPVHNVMKAPRNLKRYATIEDIEPIHFDMVFAKTEFEKVNNYDKRDPYFVPRTDKYYPELDMSTCYIGSYLYVVIPKNKEGT